MNHAPNQARRPALLAALLLVPAAACQGIDAAATPPAPDSPGRQSLTAAQTAALSDLGQMLRRPATGLPAENARGGTRVDLQGGFQHAVMVQQNPDGTHAFICTDSIDTATNFLTRAAPIEAGGPANKADEE